MYPKFNYLKQFINYLVILIKNFKSYFSAHHWGEILLNLYNFFGKNEIEIVIEEYILKDTRPEIRT